MSRSYGFFEITGVVAALDALDIMCKAADVELSSWERRLGGRLVTIIIEGDVAAVTEAIESAAANGIKKPVNYVVIANPHEEIVRLVQISRSRWDKTLKQAQKK
ncbi:MAG: BMC domain-containing protein [Blautia sp.]|nr:BMC domain-containing protein [Blautia sp.]